MADPDVLDVLAAECGLVSEVVGGLSEDEFGLPTRCPPWDVKVLLAHMWRDMDRVRTALATAPPAEADTTAVTYWRSYDPVVDAPDISDRAREVAAGFATGAGLARSFGQNWREGLEAARREDLGRIVVTWGPALRLDEFLATRVLEIGVHGLDLAAALGRDPSITSGGVAVVRGILVGLLGQEPPAVLGWDDVAFIEVGTGRRPLAANEREVLGAAAGLFPLLG